MSTVIERVQKLLSLSKSSNAYEAAAAAAIANRLIDEHRLSEADLESSPEGVVESIEEDGGFIYESGRINPWKTSLVSILVKHYGLAHWNDAIYDSGRKYSRYRLVGRKSDIDITKYMFAWLTAECARLADKEAKGAGRVFVASYCQGFVNGVAQQLFSSRAEVQKTATSAAIVKIDARSKESTDFMHKMHDLKYTKTTSQSQIDGNAFYLGKTRGASIHLGSAMGGSTTKLLGR